KVYRTVVELSAACVVGWHCGNAERSIVCCLNPVPAVVTSAEFVLSNVQVPTGVVTTMVGLKFPNCSAWTTRRTRLRIGAVEFGHVNPENRMLVESPTTAELPAHDPQNVTCE